MNKQTDGKKRTGQRKNITPLWTLSVGESIKYTEKDLLDETNYKGYFKLRLSRNSL